MTAQAANAAISTAPVLSPSSVPVRQPLVMVVDDDRVALAVTTGMLENCGYKVIGVRSGLEALEVLKKDAAEIDTVILDREMPEMNGMDVMTHMRADPQFSSIPVVMHTGSGGEQQIQEGIDAGAFYYLVKSNNDQLLKSVVSSALRERQQKRLLLGELGRHGAALKAMRSCQMQVRTLKEAEDTACFLASCFPRPARVVAGLLELLTNAVEHGNLGITYEEKARLLSENRWHEEIKRRALLPENAKKAAEVVYQQRPDMWLVQITDKGVGFDWKRYWQIDPARATASHGRGIARARLVSFDRVAYNEAGNQVTAIILATPGQTLEW